MLYLECSLIVSLVRADSKRKEKKKLHQRVKQLQKMATDNATLWLAHLDLINVYNAMSRKHQRAFVDSFSFGPEVTRHEVLHYVQALISDSE